MTQGMQVNAALPAEGCSCLPSLCKSPGAQGPVHGFVRDATHSAFSMKQASRTGDWLRHTTQLVEFATFRVVETLH